MAKRPRNKAKPSSQRWLARQQRDPYVSQAQAEGYRSRAVYKLIEIDRRERLLRRGMTVVDLGAAPGGFSQYAAERVGPAGRVIAVDRLAMDPLPGVESLEGDFTEDETLRLIEAKISEGADLVMSDMAPNISGNRAVDQPRSMYLAELALDFAQRTLKPKGTLLVKCFQGAGIDQFRAEARRIFDEVKLRKPKASRAKSPEIYLLARNLSFV